MGAEVAVGTLSIGLGRKLKRSKMVQNPTEEKLAGYLDLLQAFRALPVTKNSLTFMEVSGYPHYENVCSNILGFYFDPHAEHGLKDLFLKAFLLMAGFDEKPSLGKVSVYREFGTGEGRIDLLIDIDDFTIGIENKIFHGLNNDLIDYGRTIDKQGVKEKHVIKAVLGLKPIQGVLDGGFSSYTYNQFWRQVKNMLGDYISDAEPKWLTYLIEFINTTTNLAGENMELKQSDQFFIEHNQVVLELIAERDAFVQRLSYRIRELAELMKETEEARLLVVPPYPCSHDRLVFDFKFGNAFEISFDLFLTPAGWNLTLFGRGAPSHAYLLKLLEQPELKARIGNPILMDKGKRYSVEKWRVQDDIGEIRVKLCVWLVAINEAAIKTGDGEVAL